MLDNFDDAAHTAEATLHHERSIAILESSTDFVATTDRQGRVFWPSVLAECSGRVFWSNATARALFDVVDMGEYLERHVDLFEFLTPENAAQIPRCRVPRTALVRCTGGRDRGAAARRIVVGAVVRRRNRIVYA